MALVSARDMRDFLQVDTENMRRTQWGLRLEKFAGDWHHEFVWVPVQTYDKIGMPGADFYPYPVPATPGYAYVITDEQRPGQQAHQRHGGEGRGGPRPGQWWELARAPGLGAGPGRGRRTPRWLAESLSQRPPSHWPSRPAAAKWPSMIGVMVST